MAGAIERRAGLPDKQEGILGKPELAGKDRYTIIDRLWDWLIGGKRKQWEAPEAPRVFAPTGGGTPEELAALHEKFRMGMEDLDAAEAAKAKKDAAHRTLYGR
jgi:hypothetical protein